MKSIKYLLLGLAVGLMSTSCEKRTVEFDWTESTGKVSYQVYNFTLLSDEDSSNDIDYLYINGTEYTNNHSSLIAPYNFVPSGTVGAFYTMDPSSSMTLSMKTEAADPQYDELGAPKLDADGNPIIVYTPNEVYNQEFSYNFEADKKYQIFVYDYTKAPAVIDFGVVPIQETEIDSLGNSTLFSGRLYNFMFDAPGVPTTAKIYYGYRGNKKTNAVEYWFPENGVAFGEASDYFDQFCPRRALNGSGWAYIYYDIKAVWPDGTEQIIISKDYWSSYIGRSYHYMLYGDLNGEVIEPWIKRFTAL